MQLWLDSPALSPLPLTMFGTTLTVLEVDVVPTYVSPLDYKGTHHAHNSLSKTAGSIV